MWLEIVRRNTMRKAQILLVCYLLLCGGFFAKAQQVSTLKSQNQHGAATEREIREFYDSYAEDLRSARREAIANRYDRRGYFSLGNGRKQLVSFEESKNRYLNRWTGPKSFEWKDLSIEVLSPDAAVVTGLFDWQPISGEKATLSYSSLLTKQSGEWLIRVEDESISPVGYTTKPVSGSSSQPGLYKYILTAQPTASIAAHCHSVEMKITVRSGRKFILMGDLNNAKVQVFEAGSTFVIPAQTWHVEWWETETVEEIEVVAPMVTERASPSTPRTP